MNRKILMLIIIIIALTSISAAYASENATGDYSLQATENEDVLGETLVPAENGKVITHDVVKYYGDKETKFKVEIYDKNNNPKQGVTVNFGRVVGKTVEKTTNSKGKVAFPINYKIGTHTVSTSVFDEGGVGYPLYDNTVKIKSTITPKELVKYSTDKKKFKIQFLDSKGKKLDKKLVKIKMKGKTYKLRTDAKGIVKIKSNFKVGKTRITAINPKSGEERNLYVIVLKKGVHKVDIKIRSNEEQTLKKLKNGDTLKTCHMTNPEWGDSGVYVDSTQNGLGFAKHTKVLKVKFFFKNRNTGKIITKTSSKVKDNFRVTVKNIKGYTPYKVRVWYKNIK